MTRVPSFKRGSLGSCRVVHREFITDVMTLGVSSGFAPEGYSINPGVPATFPWLSAVANQYEMYRFHKLNFEYVPHTSTGYSAEICMALDFDALDDAPVSKSDMLSYEGASSVVVWDTGMIKYPNRLLGLGMPQRYTRLGKRTGLDLKTYDCGKLWIAAPAYNVTSSSLNAGSLWVEYDVELLIPQTFGPTTAAGSIKSDAKATTDTYPWDPLVTVVSGNLPAAITHEAGKGILTFTDAYQGLISYVAQATGALGSPLLTYSSPGLGLKLTELGKGGATAIGNSIWGDWAVAAQPGDVLSWALPSAATLANSFLTITGARYNDLVTLPD